jgi:glycosyltransferase involved in cell wall biosynthesis
MCWLTEPEAMQLRVVYYTCPWFLDHSLPLIRALSDHADVHVLLEMSREGAQVNWFGQAPSFPSGVIAGFQPNLRANAGYLSEVAEFLDRVGSFHFVVHTSRRAIAARAALQTSLAAAAKIRALRPDVLHFEHATSRSVPLFLLTPGTPKLLSIHDVHAHPGDASDVRLQKVRRMVVPHARRLLFYSRYTEQMYAQECARRGSRIPPASVVPLGIKEVLREWPGPESQEQDGTVLFFGRLSPYKGLDVLYRALPLIAGRVPRLRVIVAGDPVPDFRLPVAPPLPPTVELVTRLGTVDNSTLRRLYQEASLVVVPYVEASQSGVVQTAYAFGKPVVATTVGGLPEAVRDGVTGRLVPPRDHVALANAITELLLNPEARARMQTAITDLEATEFGWRPITRQLFAVYTATANGVSPS